MSLFSTNKIIPHLIKILVTAAVFGAAVWAQAIVVFKSFDSATPEQPPIGAHDFVAFWSAYQIAARDQNPYDATLLRIKQTQVIPVGDETRLFWSPPWLLTLLTPVLAISFRWATLCWYLLNLVFLVSSGVIAWKATSNAAVRLLPCVMTTLLFVPVWHGILNGQLSLVLTLALAIVMLAFKRRLDSLCGMALALVMIKPHFLYLALTDIVFSLLVQKRRKAIASGFLLCAVILTVSAFQFPLAYIHWNPAQNVPLHWKSVTIVSTIRELFRDDSGGIPTWPLVVVPAITFSLYMVWRLRHPSIDLNHSLPLALCLSLITAPYGWIYDQSVLLILQVALISKGYEIAWPRIYLQNILPALIVLQAGTFALRYVLAGQHQFVWFPIAVLGIWMWAMHLLTRAKELT